MNPVQELVTVVEGILDQLRKNDDQSDHIIHFYRASHPSISSTNGESYSEVLDETMPIIKIGSTATGWDWHFRPVRGICIAAHTDAPPDDKL